MSEKGGYWAIRINKHSGCIENVVENVKGFDLDPYPRTTRQAWTGRGRTKPTDECLIQKPGAGNSTR